MFGKLGLGLGLGAHRIVDRYGNKPATFTVTAGDGTKYVRVQVSETTTVTPAGGTSIRIGSSGEFVTTPLTLAANTNIICAIARDDCKCGREFAWVSCSLQVC